MKTKICGDCKQEKPLSQFYKSSRLKDGHHYYCKKCHKKWAKIWSQRPEVKTRRKEYGRKSRQHFKQEAFKTIANGTSLQCSKYKEWECCHGQSDLRFLQLDHIDGGGKKHMRELKTSNTMYRWIIANPEEARRKFQILCSNANWIKRVINRETEGGEK